MLFKATVSGISPRILEKRIKLNKTTNQFKKLIFLKKSAFFKFLLNIFKKSQKKKLFLTLLLLI